MKNLKKVNEVNAADQFIAVLDMLKALGYDTNELSILDVASLKHDIIKAINECETTDLTVFLDKGSSDLDNQESIICPGCSNTFCECDF